MHGRAGDRDLAAADREIVDAWALARGEMAGLQRLEQRLRLEAFRLDLDEAAEGVVIALPKMGVVRGDRGQAAAFVEHLVHEIASGAAAVLDRAAAIAAFDR